MKVNYKTLLTVTAIVVIFALVLTKCNQPREIIKPDDVVIHLAGQPNSLNPSNATNSWATIIFYNTTFDLINADFDKMEVVPVLAKARPTFTPIEGSDLVEMSLEIRDEATWDDGTPITVEDIIFTLKTIKIPQSKAAIKKPYFEYMRDIKVDKENPKKVVFVCSPYMLAETALSDLHILPKYFYDEQGLLDQYSIQDLNDTTKAMVDKIAADSSLARFARRFNGAEFSRKKISGSGPYTLESWKDNEEIVLKRKENWWGDNVKEKSQWFQAYPERIIFKIIADDKTALSALKNGETNTMSSINPEDYDNLKADTSFTNHHHMFEPYNYGYDFLGFNLRKPMFQDVNTRKAIAHLVDKDNLVELVTGGYGEPITSFSHPTLEKFLNQDLKPYEYNLEKAREYLKLGGWEDTNGDGIVEKEIDGKRVDFTFTLATNQGNERRGKTVEIVAANAQKVGINMKIDIMPFKTFVPLIRGGQFDMINMGLISSPFESDPKQNWHSTSRGNYTGFANTKADEIIETMRLITDQEERYQYYHDLHKIIHEEVPVIFLLTLRERIAISKKFIGVYGSGMKPGFWASGFELAEKN